MKERIKIGLSHPNWRTLTSKMRRALFSILSNIISHPNRLIVFCTVNYGSHVFCIRSQVKAACPPGGLGSYCVTK